MDLHFAWQACHLVTWTCTLRGRRGTYGTGLAFVAHLVPSSRRCRRGCWRGRRGTYGTALASQLTPQLWHLATSPFTLRGRRGTWRHGPPLCVASVALGDIDLHFAWQAWHLWHWTGFGGALGSQLTPLSPRLLEWQAWHLATSPFTLRGRRGTWRHRLPLCVAGVALTPPRRGCRGCLCGRCGTWRHRLSLCVAGVALMALGWRLVRVWRRGRRVTLPGRRGTW